MYRLGLVFGNAVYATAATLAAFFLGLSIGGWFWGNAVERLRSPLRIYGLMELGVALTALLLIPGMEFYTEHYQSVTSLLGGNTGLMTIAKFIFSASLLLLPTILMGGTFPVLAHYIDDGPQQLARRGTLLYSLNTLGAATGALATGFFLLSSYGVSATYSAAVMLAAGVGIAAVVLDFFSTPVPEHKAQRTRNTSSRPSIPRSLMITLAFTTGLLALSAEILWTRMFAQVLQNSVYSFSAILVTFLIALGAGGLLSHVLARTSLPAIPVLITLLTTGGLLVGLSPLMFDFLTGGLGYVAARATWPEYLQNVFYLAALVVFPPTAVIGAVFPFLLKAARAGQSAAGRFVGHLVLFNSLGSSAGPVLAGFFLLDLLGLWGSIKIIALSYGVLALWTARNAGAEPLPRWQVAFPAVTMVLVLIVTNPPLLRLGPGQKLLDVLQASDGVVTVVEAGDNLQVRLDNYYLLGDTRSALVEQMQGHVPLLLHPAPKQVLFLGMGTGITAGAALNHATERVITVELIPNVIRAAKRYFAPWTNGLFSDARAEIIADDARNYLLGSQQKFDVIVGDLFTPWHAGTGSLYTVEHFQLAKNRLAPGGIFAQWLPMYQLTPESFATITATFASVFPTVTLWRADFSGERTSIALVGQETGARLEHAVLLKNITNVIARDDSAGAPEQHMAGLFYLGNWRALAPRLAGMPLNTDDKRTVEFMAPVQSQKANAGLGGFIVGKELEKLLEVLVTAVPANKDPYLADLPSRERRYVEVGYLYYRYLQLKAAGDAGEEMEKLKAKIAELAPNFAIGKK